MRKKWSIFVVARNAWGRPTLQHRVEDYVSDYTACGRYIGTWSRSFSDKSIEAILCKHPACREGS